MATDGGGSVWNPSGFLWEEKNYNAWGKQDVQDRLSGIAVSENGVSLRVTSVSDLTVTAGLTVRRGKQWPAFEVNATCKWEAKRGEAAAAGGKFVVPELFPDDLEDEFEILVSFDGGAPDNGVREVIQRKLLPEIRQAMKAFGKALVAKGAGNDADERRREEAAKAAAAASIPTPAAAPSTMDMTAVAKAVAAAEDAPPTTKPAGTGSEWNADAFHWEEKSLTKWARVRLGKMLRRLEFELPGSTFKIVGLTKLDGEASTSTRKGRKLVFFDFVIEGKWEGELVDGDGEVVATGDGEFRVPDVDQDTDPASLEIEVTVAEDGDGDDKKLTKVFKKYGVPELRDVFATFLAELKAQ